MTCVRVEQGGNVGSADGSRSWQLALGSPHGPVTGPLSMLHPVRNAMRIEAGSTTAMMAVHKLLHVAILALASENRLKAT